MLDRRGGQNCAAGVGCCGHVGNHVGGDGLCRHGDGDGVGAVVRRACVDHRQRCTGGVRLLHRDGGRLGIRTGDNFQNVRIGARPAPCAAVGRGLGGSQREVFVTVGLAAGRIRDAHACVRFLHRSHGDKYISRCVEVVGGGGAHANREAARRGGCIGSLQHAARQRDARGRALQRVNQLCAAVGVVKACPAGDVRVEAVLDDLR